MEYTACLASRLQTFGQTFQRIFNEIEPYIECLILTLNSFILVASVDEHEESKVPLSTQSNEKQHEPVETSKSMRLPHFPEPFSDKKYVRCEVPWENVSTSGTMNTSFAPLSQTDWVSKTSVFQNVTTNFQSINCMKQYENKSPDELRFEDYIYNKHFPFNESKCENINGSDLNVNNI